MGCHGVFVDTPRLVTITLGMRLDLVAIDCVFDGARDDGPHAIEF